MPATTLLATILHNALDDRPIYFAMTTQAYEELNLGAYLIRHGVALKLNNGPVEQDLERGIFQLDGEMAFMLGRFVDVPRTEELITNVFMHRGGFPDRWTRWVDPATDQIPAYYAYSHYGMEAIYRALGNAERANFHRERYDAFWRLYSLRYDPG